MKKALIVLTARFPYMPGEEFIQNEEAFWKYDKIFVYPENRGEKIYKHKNPKIQIIPPKIPYFSNNRIKQFFDKSFTLEFGFLSFFCKIYKFMNSVYTSKFKLLHDCQYIYIRYKHVLKTIKKDPCYLQYEFDIYSFWISLGARVGILLKEKIGKTFVCRCHSYDLYDDRMTTIQKRWRDWAVLNADMVFPCSEQGEKYLTERYHKYSDKICTAYLGTKDYGIRTVSQYKAFHLVSCSYIVPVKRLSLIIDVLSLFNNKIQLKWTHIGGVSNLLQNDYFDSLKQLAKKKLVANIDVSFLGAMDNCDVISYYQKNDVHAFINVSESEGLPVSIIEAISFGIPIIATNVGGVNEIVCENFGFLLEKNFEAETCANFIWKLYSLWNENNAEYYAIRDSARQYWESNFSAEKNYTHFVEILQSMNNERNT